MRLDPAEMRSVELDSLSIPAFGLHWWLALRTWEEGGLVDDAAVFRRALRGKMTAREFDAAWSEVRPLMTVGVDGRLRIPWVERVRDETIANLRSQAERQRQHRLRSAGEGVTTTSGDVTVTARDVTPRHRQSPDGRTDERTDGRTYEESTLRDAHAAESAPAPKTSRLPRIPAVPDWAAHPGLDTPAMRAAWDTWSTHRRELKSKPWTPTGLAQCFAELAALGPERAIAAIHHSVARNWAGIHEAHSAPTQSGGSHGHVPSRSTRRSDGTRHGEFPETEIRPRVV